MTFAEDIQVNFEDIGGLEEVKRSLYEAIVLPVTRPELFSKKIHGIPKGILFYGPPGIVYNSDICCFQFINAQELARP